MMIDWQIEVYLLADLPNLPYSRGIGVRSGMRAPGRRIGVMVIMLGCVGDRFLYGDNVSNLYKATNTDGVLILGSVYMYVWIYRILGGQGGRVESSTRSQADLKISNKKRKKNIKKLIACIVAQENGDLKSKQIVLEFNRNGSNMKNICINLFCFWNFAPIGCCAKQGSECLCVFCNPNVVSF